jgi:arsenite/tail-anchored protein-transporting ATPase
MRIMLYTGKGGVGKTSVAAATALACAERGLRTLVISTDAAHSLADSFDTTLAAEPRQLSSNLWGQEIDVYHQMDEYYGVVQGYLSKVLAWRGLDDVMASEMTAFPGMEELASLMVVEQHHDSGKYDVIIIDAAPTGETLRFLSFPDVASWWLEKIFPVGRKATQLLGPVMQPILNIPLPTEDVFDAVKEGMTRLGHLRSILTDPKTASIRLVVNPEKMVIKEAQRTYTYLGLYGYATDLVICNRVFPDDLNDSYFANWRGIQSRYLALIEESFSPLPIRQIPMFSEEVVGVEMLKKMGKILFGDDDPSAVFYKGTAQSIDKTTDGYLLKVPLPLASKDAIDLTRLGDELIVRIGNQRRNLTLPHVLLDCDVAAARLEDGQLQVTFKDKDKDKQGVKEDKSSKEKGKQKK